MPRPDEPRDVELARVTRIARILDDGFVDPLLGLLPIGGDAIGSLLGLYVVGLALRRKVAPVIIARMLLNLTLDAAVGSVPILGDFFDLVWKANDKNVKLLTDRSAHGGKASAKDWLAVVGAAALFIGVIVLVIFAIGAMLHALGSYFRW